MNKKNSILTLILGFFMFIALVYIVIILEKEFEEDYELGQAYTEGKAVLVEDTGIIFEKHYTSNIVFSKYYFTLEDTTNNKRIDKEVSLDEYNSHRIGDEFVYALHYEMNDNSN